VVVEPRIVAAARTHSSRHLPVLFKKAVDAFIPTQTHLGEENGESEKQRLLKPYFKAA
jgi:hypothetical protein